MRSVFYLSTFLCFAISALAYPYSGHALYPSIREPPGASSAIVNVNFAAANPNYYNRSEGGGIFADRVLSLTTDDVRKFSCNDIVSFFIAFEVDSNLPSDISLSAQFDVTFESDSSGDSGAGYVEFIRAVLNEGDPYVNRAYGSTHMITFYQTKYGTPLVSYDAFKPYTEAAIEMSGLIAGEKIVIRLDARLGCHPDTEPTGLVQAILDRAAVLSPAEYSYNAFQGTQSVALLVDGITTGYGSAGAGGPTPAPIMTSTPSPSPTLAPNQCYCISKFVVAPSSSVCMDYKGIDGDAMYCQLRPCKDSYKDMCDPVGTSICTKNAITRQVLRFLSFRDELNQEAFCEYKTVNAEYMSKVTLSSTFMM